MNTSPFGAAVDSRRFAMQMERVRLALLLTIGGPNEQLGTELDGINAELARLPPCRVDALARRLRLHADDVDFLWTVVAAGHDARVAPHVLALGGVDHRGGASLALHVQGLGLDAARARTLTARLQSDHPLIREGLLVGDLTDSPATRVLRAPERVAAYLAGSDALDAAITSCGGILTAPEAPLIDDGQQRLIDMLVYAMSSTDDAAIVLEGPSGVGRRTLAAIAADECRRPAICVDLAATPRSLASVESLMLAVRREVSLRDGAVVVISNIDELSDVETVVGDRLRALGRMIERLGAVVVLTSAMPGIELATGRALLRLRVPSPEAEMRAQLWAQNLDDCTEIDIPQLAQRYRIGPGTLVNAARAARLCARVRGSSTLTVRDLIDGVQTTIAERLGGLAQRVEPRERWDDLVLTKDTLDQIRGVIARVRHSHEVLDGWGFRSRLPRGAGVAALFSGPPGTGKTMVAGLIARELDLELYQVDLSRVVSKWVGETEKQLARIFDAAEAGHALLLFDEADSLFAKRTEVKAAVDRYANLEVNYLLQRVEAFGGVTILTTNMDTSIDPALKRRLAAHVVFWPPDEGERAALWARMIPENAPRQGKLDFERLAREYSDMSGGHIRNAAIAGAFLAASESSPIRQKYLEQAARLEYRSMGHVLGKRDGL